MNSLMNDPFFLLLISCAIGFLIGILTTRIGFESKLVRELKKERDKLAAEKMELSKSLNEQLLKIRSSIEQSIDAYQSALQTVEEKLEVSEEERLALSPPESPPLKIDYQADADQEPQQSEQHADEFVPEETAAQRRLSYSGR